MTALPIAGERPTWARMLIEHRIALGCSVAQIARESALHRATLFRLENTEMLPPSRCVLVWLARGLGLDDCETAHLLLAAGYLPDDATMLLVARLLFDGVMPEAHIERFRHQVAAVAGRYRLGDAPARKEGAG